MLCPLHVLLQVRDATISFVSSGIISEFIRRMYGYFDIILTFYVL